MVPNASYEAGQVSTQEARADVVGANTKGTSSQEAQILILALASRTLAGPQFQDSGLNCRHGPFKLRDPATRVLSHCRLLLGQHQVPDTPTLSFSKVAARSKPALGEGAGSLLCSHLPTSSNSASPSYHGAFHLLVDVVELQCFRHANCPFWPQLGAGPQILDRCAATHSAGWKSEFERETPERERQHLTLPTDGARWQPMAVPVMARIFSAWEPSGGLRQTSSGQPQPRPENWAWSRERLHPNQSQTGSGLSTGRHGNEQRYPRASRSPHFARAQMQLGCRAPLPTTACVPAASRPQTRVPPFPTKWIPPRPRIRTRNGPSGVFRGGSTTWTLLGHGDGDHPPPLAAASRRPRCGRWAR